MPSQIASVIQGRKITQCALILGTRLMISFFYKILYSKSFFLHLNI